MLITDQIKMFSESPPGRTCRIRRPASPTPPTCTPRACGSWRETATELDIPLREAYISIATVLSMRPRRRSGLPGSGGRRGGDVHRAGGHYGWPLRHGGAGSDPAVQHGGGDPGSALSEQEVLDAAGGCPEKFSGLIPGLFEENVRSL